MNVVASEEVERSIRQQEENPGIASTRGGRIAVGIASDADNGPASHTRARMREAFSSFDWRDSRTRLVSLKALDAEPISVNDVEDELIASIDAKRSIERDETEPRLEAISADDFDDEDDDLVLVGDTLDEEEISARLKARWQHRDQRTRN